MAVLVTAAATALGLAVVVGPAADAAPPAPTYVGELRITSALDDGLVLPGAAPAKDAAGFVIPGDLYTIHVESRLPGSTNPLDTYDVERDATITISDGTNSYTTTIEAGTHSATVTGAKWVSTSNFKLTATANKQAALRPDTLPVTVALKSSNPTALAPGQLQKLAGCTQDDPTCVSVSFSGTGNRPALLSTSECANFLDGTAKKQQADGSFTAYGCRDGKQGAKGQVGQVFIDLDPTAVPREVATVVLDCDKLVCSNGGVSSFVPWVDKKNSGTFVQPEPCPSKGVLGEGQHVCVDFRQSTRDNAGDLHTYILFDYDLRMSH